jgi:hypothetical protein
MAIEIPSRLVDINVVATNNLSTKLIAFERVDFNKIIDMSTTDAKMERSKYEKLFLIWFKSFS